MLLLKVTSIFPFIMPQSLTSTVWSPASRIPSLFFTEFLVHLIFEFRHSQQGNVGRGVEIQILADLQTHIQEMGDGDTPIRFNVANHLP